MSDKLAELYVEITARTDKLKADLAKAEAEVTGSGKKMEAAATSSGQGIASGLTKFIGPALITAGVVVATAFAEMVKNTIALGHELTIMSKRTGLSTTFLQSMGYAAEMTGGKLKDIEQISQRMTQTIAKAGEGNKAAVKTLTDLGLSYDLLKTKTPEEQFRMIFDAVAKIPDPIERALAAQQSLGSADFLPLIDQYRQLEEQQKKLGGMTPEQIAQADAAAVEIKKLEVAWKSFGDQLALFIIPDLTPLVGNITALIGALKWLTDEYNKLPNGAKMLLGMTSPMGVVNTINSGVGSLMNNPKPPEKFASGGIVTQPQLAMVGEAGPEAIIPLSQMGNMGGGSVVVNVGNYMGDEISKRALVRDIQRILNEESRRSSFKPTETSYYSAGGHL